MTESASQTVRVDLEQGLHMVPCSLIVRTAERFSCDIRIKKEDRTVNAKTMLELLTLSAENGNTLILHATGDEAREAIEALARLFETNFNDSADATNR